MANSENVEFLVNEYVSLIDQRDEKTLIIDQSPDFDALTERLITEGNWTASGAEHLMRLTKDNGVFMLRNALAFAIALEIEDGGLGF